MTVLALCVIRGKSNFTQYRLSTSKLRNAFSTVSKYNGSSIISFGILGKTCFIASPIFFILAINESFSICLSLSISRFSFLRLSASRLCLFLLIVLVLSQSFYSQLLMILAFLLLLSLRSFYSLFLVPLLLLFLSLLLSLDRLLLVSLSQHSLRLLSPFPELKPLLAPLLFYKPLSCPAFDFLIPV